MIEKFKARMPEAFRNRYRTLWNALRLNVKIVLGKLGRFLWRPTLPELGDNRVNLHLGCGQVLHPAFINIDAVPSPHVHYVQRIDNLSNFSDGSVDLIYSSHCLEHFERDKVMRVLSEWYRVLKDGGTLRISVPDFDSLLDVYEASGRQIEMIASQLLGAQNYKFNFHKSVFTERYLTMLLKATGFSEVKIWYPQSDELTNFDDGSVRKIYIGSNAFQISLNIQGVKKCMDQCAVG